MDELFISCPHYFEELLVKELKDLGVTKVRQGFCGVYAKADMQNVYVANYLSRIATRVLWPLIQFGCPDKESLYKMAKKVNWDLFLDTETTFAIDSNVNHPNLKNSLFASLVVKDAICDYFRDKTGARPSVDIQNPQVQLNLFVNKGQATIYFDTSRTPLHKRGWRLENTEATLHESLAAALLMTVGYNKDMSLCDPFCGSGTFLVEAAMIASNTPAGFYRKNWGFAHHPQYNEAEWLKVKKEADSKIIPLNKGMIFGSDKDNEAFKTCYRHLKGTNLRGIVELENQDVANLYLPIKPDLILCNPPYGKRLEFNRNIISGIKRFLEQRCSENTRVYILTSDPMMIRNLNMKASTVISFKNGGLSVSLYCIEGRP